MKKSIFSPKRPTIFTFLEMKFNNCWLRRYKNFNFSLHDRKVMAEEDDDLHTNNP